MGHSPAAQPGGSYRVVRHHSKVTETVVVAADALAAKQAAKLLRPAAWQERRVNQYGDEDAFEYDTVAPTSDNGVD